MLDIRGYEAVKNSGHHVVLRSDGILKLDPVRQGSFFTKRFSMLRKRTQGALEFGFEILPQISSKNNQTSQSLAHLGPISQHRLTRSSEHLFSPLEEMYDIGIYQRQRCVEDSPATDYTLVSRIDGYD